MIENAFEIGFFQALFGNIIETSTLPERICKWDFPKNQYVHKLRFSSLTFSDVYVYTYTQTYISILFCKRNICRIDFSRQSSEKNSLFFEDNVYQVLRINRCGFHEDLLFFNSHSLQEMKIFDKRTQMT